MGEGKDYNRQGRMQDYDNQGEACVVTQKTMNIVLRLMVIVFSQKF